NANATGGVISDTLPNNTNFVPGTLAIEPSGTGTLGSFPAIIRNLVVTGGQQITVTFMVTAAFPLANGTVITNTAAVTSSQQTTPKTDTVTTTVVAVPDIQISKTGPVSANVLSTVVYTFTVINAGDTPLQNIVLTDNRIGPVTNRLPGSDSNNNN